MSNEPADTRTAATGGSAPLVTSLVLLMAVGPLPLFAMGALGPVLREELSLTGAQLGLLPTLAFLIAGLLAFFGGRSSDVLGPRRIALVLYASSALSYGLFASSGSYALMLVALAFAGLAISVANPVTNALIAGLVPAPRRGMVTGIKQSGVQVGQVLAGVLVPFGALVIGWRVTLGLLILLPLLGAALVLRTLPSSIDVAPKTSSASPGASPGAVPATARRLGFYSFCLATMMQSTTVYGSLYAFDQVGLGVAPAGAIVGVTGAVGIVARIAWGRVVDTRESPKGALVTLAAISTASCAMFLAAEYVGAWLLWMATVGFGVSAVAANVVIMMAVIRSSPAGVVGRSTGLVVLGMYLGFAAGPPAFGLLVDMSGSYTGAWAAGIGVCSLATVVAARLP